MAYPVRSECVNGHPFTDDNTRVYTTKSGGSTRQCVECNRLRQRSRTNVPKTAILIKPDEYIKLFESQGGVCAICARPDPRGHWLCVDHDHETGRVRGLLCKSCNRALGLMQDNALALDAAASYLRSHEEVDHSQVG